MAKFEVCRYIFVKTMVEADDAEDAVLKERDMDITGELVCNGALDFSWEVSDCMGVMVYDENDDLVWEDG
mgnify:CR=1 FL=1